MTYPMCKGNCGLGKERRGYRKRAKENGTRK